MGGRRARRAQRRQERRPVGVVLLGPRRPMTASSCTSGPRSWTPPAPRRIVGHQRAGPPRPFPHQSHSRAWAHRGRLVGQLFSWAGARRRPSRWSGARCPQLFAATGPGVRGGQFFGPSSLGETRGRWRRHASPSRPPTRARRTALGCGRGGDGRQLPVIGDGSGDRSKVTEYDQRRCGDFVAAVTAILLGSALYVRAKLPALIRPEDRPAPGISQGGAALVVPTRGCFVAANVAPVERTGSYSSVGRITRPTSRWRRT